MLEEKQDRIKCPFCEGGALVKLNAKNTPFISCPTCGPINLRGRQYQQYIERHKRTFIVAQIVKEEAKTVEKRTGMNDIEPKELYSCTAFEADKEQQSTADPWEF